MLHCRYQIYGLTLNLLLVYLASCQFTDTFSISSFTGPITATASSNCDSILTSCQFAQPECVSAWCEGSCNDGNNCCRQANPQFCLVKANLQDPCINMENSVVICPEALPSCLCYNDAGMYAPESFGAMALSCSSIAGSQYPQLLQYITGENGTLALCTRYAGPRNGTATTTPTSVPSTAASPSPTPTTAAAQSTTSTKSLGAKVDTPQLLQSLLIACATSLLFNLAMN